MKIEELDFTNRFVDSYFLKTKDVLANDTHNPEITMQVFQRNTAIVCGTNCAIQLFDKLKRNVIIYYVEDGTEVEPWETVMHITGKASAIVDLETIYLGILARCTKIATNVRNIRKLTDKNILFFPARFDVPEVQEYDGYAAKVGGATGCSTDAQMLAFGGKGIGTMPHALIALYKGDVPLATLKYAQAGHTPIIALVDYNNDCVTDALRTARLLRDEGYKLDGVRLDTSGNMTDKAIQRLEERPLPPSEHINYYQGVNPLLVRLVRETLDAEEFTEVKIYVSGGFNEHKVKLFESGNVSVDGYGIGSSMFSGNFDYTADIVEVDGKHESKAGREFRAIRGNHKTIKIGG